MQYMDFNEKRAHGSPSFPVGYYYVDETHPQYHMPFHWHMEYEILRVVTGCLVLSLDQKEICAEAGDLVFIGDGVLHSGIPSGCTYECLVFDLQMLRKISETCSQQLRPLSRHEICIFEHIKQPASAPDQYALLSLSKQLFLTASAPDADALAVSGYLLLLFSKLFECRYYMDSAKQTPRNYKQIMQLKQVLELIEQSYASPLTLSDLSKAAGMTPKYFCRYFHGMTKRTPIDYLNHYRIECAAHLLRNSDQSVLNVAEAVGFNDVSYFIKTFRRYKGVTPKAVRKLSESPLTN